MEMDKDLFKDVEERISLARVFDTHEHLQYESERRKNKYDFYLFFRHYASTDLLGAGMDPADLDRMRAPGLDLIAKWKLFEPFWMQARNTTYSRVISIIARDLYGVDEIDFSATQRISQIMRDPAQEHSYATILRQKCRIENVLNDLDDERRTHGVTQTKPDAAYFLPVLRIDRFLGLYSEEDFCAAEQEAGVPLESLSAFSNMVDGLFEARKASAFAFKIGAPYLGRNIRFESVSRDEAEISFRKALANRGQFKSRCSPAELKPFQDFIYHQCLRNASACKMPVQIHTGLVEGTRCDIRTSNPLDLIDLVRTYPEVTFDLFHAGFPFTYELAAIVKAYPNCYMNMCWVPEISQRVYERFLAELLELLPSNKLFGFGGDYFFVEGTYAALKLAKQSITRVMYDKISNGVVSLDDAMGIVERILFQNAQQVYLRQR